MAARVTQVGVSAIGQGGGSARVTVVSAGALGVSPSGAVRVTTMGAGAIGLSPLGVARVTSMTLSAFGFERSPRPTRTGNAA